MKEVCYVMVKPGFTDERIIKRVIEEICSNGFELIDEAYIKYDDECARLHYIEKQAKSYCHELTEYLVSDISYGMIYEGENAVTKIRDIVENLRSTLKEEFNLQTDVMRNILHCSSKTKVGSTMLELDTQREVAIFEYLKNK